MKKFLGTFLVAALGATLAVGIWQFFDEDEVYYTIESPPAYQFTNNGAASTNTVAVPDFTAASAMATPAVVHIKSYISASATTSKDPLLELFHDHFMPEGEARAAGSGVIISPEGLIATNNHVIDDAGKVEVTLFDKRTYKATVLGTDPTTDLALLRIDEKELPHLRFANSNDVKVGEWVLAVGNPFNLTSTVTAGIVSAKGRTLNLLDEEFAIESFIQTDAAVNPGNSGGALINTNGELIGINTAIASQTGSYAGYSFAVPSNLVAKVMLDLEEYGQVQRAIIGVRIQNIDSKLAEEEGLTTLNGAYISDVIRGGSAEEYGIERGDVITAINGDAVNSSSELQERVATYRPGDQVKVSIIRDGNPKQLSVTLKNQDGNTELVKRELPEIADRDVPSVLGAEYVGLTRSEKKKLGIENGIKVTEVLDEQLEDAGMKPGYVITRINKKPVNTTDDVRAALARSQDRVVIEGVNEDGTRMNFSLDQ